MARIMRLLGAIRLSRHRGEGDPSTSPDRQEATISEVIETRGTLAGWARDLDVSAIKLSPFDRPALGDWLNNREDEFDGIVWSRLDRGVRSMTDLHKLAQWATEKRKVLIFAAGPSGSELILDLRAGPLDPIPHLIIMILAFAAQMEAQAIQERNRDARAYLRTVGRWYGGTTPYQLRAEKQGVGWKLVENHDTTATTLEIIDRVIAGESRMSIAADLNRRGVPSPREYRALQDGKITVAPATGRVEINGDDIIITPEDSAESIVVSIFPKGVDLAVKNGDIVEEGQRLTLPTLWHRMTINRICQHRSLIGQLEVEGQVVSGDDGMPVSIAKPLIDRATWEALQRAISPASWTTGRPRTAGASQLLDIAFCSLCGEKLYVRNLKKKNTSHRYYNCRSAWGFVSRQAKSERCKARAMNADHLEALVGDMLLETIGDYDMTEKVLIPGSSHHQELEDATAALQDLIKRTAGKPAVIQKIWAEQIRSLEERIVSLSELPEEPDRYEERSVGETYREIWREADSAGRRNLLQKAGIRVAAGRLEDDRDEWDEAPEIDLSGREADIIRISKGNGMQVSMSIPRDIVYRTTGQEADLGYRDKTIWEARTQST